jgi:hypothetical protein
MVELKYSFDFFSNKFDHSSYLKNIENIIIVVVVCFINESSPKIT